jgi:hypothetical protein
LIFTIFEVGSCLYTIGTGWQINHSSPCLSQIVESILQYGSYICISGVVCIIGRCRNICQILYKKRDLLLPCMVPGVGKIVKKPAICMRKTGSPVCRIKYTAPGLLIKAGMANQNKTER